MSKNPELRRSCMCMIFQAFVALALVIFVGLAYVNSLWSQTYLQEVQESWEKGPIIDVKFVDAIDQNSNIIDGAACPQGYELATSLVWDGSLAACDCSQARFKKYPALEKGICTYNQTRDGCRDINERSPKTLSVFNGKLICTQRDQSMNFYSMKRPIQLDTVNTEVSCQQGSKLCGNSSSNSEYQICILDNATCPIVNLEFQSVVNAADNTTTLVMVESTDNLPSLPLIDFKMSEHGPPCIDPSQQNTSPDKKQHFLLRNTNTDGCSTYIYEQNICPQYRAVKNYPQLSEYTLLEQNSGILTFLKKIPGYITYYLDHHNLYHYSLYQKAYPHWSYACHVDTVNPVTPTHVRELMIEASSIKNFAVALLCLAIAVIVLSLTNVLAIVFNRQGMCSKKSTRKCGLFRFILTLVTCLAAGGVLIKLFMVSSIDSVEFLAQHDCTQDRILEQSFITMNAYFERLTLNNWICIGFLLAILTIDIVTAIVNTTARFIRVRNKRKLKNMKEHLLNKQLLKVQNDMK